MAEADGVRVATLVRNGVAESVHLGHVVVCTDDGDVVTSIGDADRETYVRSAVKPFQALAVLRVLDAAGVALDDAALAIACASHSGSDDQQIEAARLLADAGLDESALQCPPAIPRDPDTAWSQRWPYPLSHNCSGKHAAFLLATAVAGDDVASYLAVDSPLQRRVREAIAEACDAIPAGPGVDGCGAPAWRLPLRGLATGFARLVAGRSDGLGRARRAMMSHPVLVGGHGLDDTEMMKADGRVVAKRGAEAVFAAGIGVDGRSLGVAVKVSDGGVRASGPLAAAVVEQAGCAVPPEVRRPPVIGGGQVQGVLEIDGAVTDALRRAVD